MAAFVHAQTSPIVSYNIAFVLVDISDTSLSAKLCVQPTSYLILKVEFSHLSIETTWATHVEP